VIKLGGDESFYNGNVQLYAHDIERTYGPRARRVTRGGGKGQLAGKIVVRIERKPPPVLRPVIGEVARRPCQ
jgi:hypothetical protein